MEEAMEYSWLPPRLLLGGRSDWQVTSYRFCICYNGHAQEDIPITTLLTLSVKMIVGQTPILTTWPWPADLAQTLCAIVVRWTIQIYVSVVILTLSWEILPVLAIWLQTLEFLWVVTLVFFVQIFSLSAPHAAILLILLCRTIILNLPVLTATTLLVSLSIWTIIVPLVQLLFAPPVLATQLAEFVRLLME